MSVRSSVRVALSSAGLVVLATSPIWAGQPDAEGDFPKTGLVWWFSAEQVEVGTDKTVQTLKDRSGNDNPATHLTGAKDDATQPKLATDTVSGLPVLSFSGVTTGFVFKEISDIRTTFWVLSKDPKGFGNKGEQTAFGGAKTCDFHVGYEDTIFNGVAPGHLSKEVGDGQTYLNGTKINPQSTLYPKTLSLISVVTTGNCHASYIGKDRDLGRSWIGNIAEMLVYNVALTDADRMAVEKYLIRKYGLDGNPPAKRDGGTAGVDAAVDACCAGDVGTGSGAGGSGTAGSPGTAGITGVGGAAGKSGSTAVGGSTTTAGTAAGGSTGQAGNGGSTGQVNAASKSSSGCNAGGGDARKLPSIYLMLIAALAMVARRRRGC